jgi:hypothetical protein
MTLSGGMATLPKLLVSELGAVFALEVKEEATQFMSSTKPRNAKLELVVSHHTAHAEVVKSMGSPLWFDRLGLP